jgi:hypothetical protein
MGHDRFEYGFRRVILSQQTGHVLEFLKIQIDNCPPGRDFPSGKELKRGYLHILPTSAFGRPIHDSTGIP